MEELKKLDESNIISYVQAGLPQLPHGHGLRSSHQFR